jgi:hypothetical protein
MHAVAWSARKGGAALVVAATLASFPARAAPVQLEWSAPGACPQAAHVHAEVERLVGGWEKVARERGIEAEAQVALTSPRRWRLVLRVRGAEAEGTRVLEGESCEALADAAALVLALALSPEAVEEQAALAGASSGAEAVAGPRTSGPEEPGGALTAPQPSEKGRTHDVAAMEEPEDGASPGLGPVEAPAHATPTGETRTSARLGLEIVGDAGTLPRPALGAAVVGGVAWRRLRVVGSVMALGPRRGTLEAPEGAGGRFLLVAAAVRVCGVLLDRRRGYLGPCTALELGTLRGEGEGVSDPGRGRALWAAVAGGVQAGMRLMGPWFLTLRVEALVPLARPTFLLEGIGAVHRPSAAVGRVGLGLEVGFP